MKNRKHYFFKQGSKNSGFNKLLNKVKLSGLKNQSAEFGIFYCNSVTPQNMMDGTYSSLKLSKNSKPQIKNFIEINKGDCIWIFETMVYCFECVDDTIKEYIAGSRSIPDYLDQGAGNTNVKTKTFKLFHAFELYEVSEMFSSTSGHYGYNQKTIREFVFDSPQYKVCESLVENDKIKIDGRNFYEFLSPSQFETLSFMIFYLYGKIPRSHIGSTRKHVDLEVYDKQSNLSKLYQVKMKDISKEKSLDYLFKNNIWTIHTGPTVFVMKRLGIDWILSKVCLSYLNTDKVVSLQEWLRHLYPKNLFSYEDVCSHFESRRYFNYLENFKVSISVTPSALVASCPERGQKKNISINEEGEINCIHKNHIEDIEKWKIILEKISTIIMSVEEDIDNTNETRDAGVINVDIQTKDLHRKITICSKEYDDKLSEVVELSELMLELI